MKNSEKSAGVYRIRRAFSSDFSSKSAQDWCLVIGAELLRYLNLFIQNYTVLKSKSEDEDLCQPLQGHSSAQQGSCLPLISSN